MKTWPAFWFPGLELAVDWRSRRSSDVKATAITIGIAANVEEYFAVIQFD
jgi:hypothetical protein